MNTKFFLSALGMALLLACFASPFASSLPDGLDQFAQDHAVQPRDTPAWKNAPLAEYSTPAVSNPRTSTGLAGGVGVLLVFGLLSLAGKALASRASGSESKPRHA